MRLVLLIIFYIAALFTLRAQKNTQKGLTALLDNNFGLSKSYFYKDFKKDSLSASFGFFKYYMSDFVAKNDSAYHYMLQTTKLWSATTEKNKLKIQNKIPISDSILFELFNDLAIKEFNTAVSNESIGQLDQVIFRYGSAFSKLDEIAIQYRDSLAYQQAVRANTAEAFSLFIESYPNSEQLKNAITQYQLLDYLEKTDSSSEQNLARFISENPDSPHLEKAWQRLFELYNRSQNIENCELFIQRYPNAPSAYLNEAWGLIYKFFMQPFTEEKFISFKNTYADYPFSEELAKDEALIVKSLFPFVLDGAFGYMDENGAVVIEPQYSEAGAFKNGMAIVAQNNDYGLINKKNEMLIPMRYLDISHWSEGLILEDSLGFYLVDSYFMWDDSSPLTYEEVQQLLSSVEASNDSTVDNNKQQFEPIEKNKKFGLSKNGKKIIEPKYDQIFFDSPRGIVTVNNGKSLLYFDSTGKQLQINGLEWFTRAAELAQFSKDGLAVFSKAGKFGLINKDGKVLVKNIYQDALVANNGLWPVKQNELWGIITLNSKIILPLEYKRIIPFLDDCYLVEGLNGIGLIDSKGNWILKPEYKTIKLLCDSYLLIENNMGLGICLLNGDFLLNCGYERIMLFNSSTLQLANKEGLSYYLLDKRQLVQYQP